MPTYVPGEGPRRCLMALIGQAPGAEEDRLGRPFQGAAGNVLNTKLHLVGIPRMHCYVTNVVKERPPGNDFSIYWAGSARNKKPTPALIMWRDALLKELDTLETNLFVPMGADAMWALTGLTEIEKWRGSILSTTLPSGRKVKTIATYHPAAILYEPKKNATLSIDIQRCASEYKFPELKLPERTLQMAPTFDDLLSIGWTEGNPLSYDIETSLNEIVCVGLGLSSTLAVCIPTTVSYWGSTHKLKEVIEIINWHLAEAEGLKIAQWMPFDFQYLLRFFRIKVRKPWFDTMMAQYACYCELPKGLDFLASVYTREPYYKDDLKVWRSGVSSMEKLWEYNARDCAVTYEVYEKLSREMKELKVEGTFSFIMKLMEPLLFMMYRGVRIDEAARHKHEVLQKARIADLEFKLKSTYDSINPRSHKQVKELAYGQLRMVPIVKDGKATVNKDAIKKLSAKHPAIQLIADVRSEQTIYSNYCKISLDGLDNRMRCTFNPAGTTTRRLSSSESVFDTGRNLQNWPLQMRDMIVPDWFNFTPNHKYTKYEELREFTSADLSGAESRVVAYASEDPIAIKVFESGKNIHRITAAMIFDLHPDQVDKDRKECDRKGIPNKSKYFMAKKLRHSVEKAGSWVTVQEQLGITAAEAKVLHARFHKQNPNLNIWFQKVAETLRRNKNTLVSPFGDIRIFFGPVNHQMIKDAVAHIAQDIVGKVINTIIISLYHGICKELEDVELLLQVHDSVLIQHLKRHRREVYDALEGAANIKIPWSQGHYTIPIEMKSGNNGRL